MMIGMTAHMLLNIVDGIYVSRLGLEASLAVLNYGFPFFYLIFAVFNGLTSGATSVLARNIGAGELAKAENSLSQITWSGLFLFVVFLFLMPFALPAYLHLQEASLESSALTWRYLIALFAGVPFLVIALLLGSGLRAEGNTKTLMKGLLAGTLLNIALAPFLIYETFTFAGLTWKGTGWGVAGAGIATTVANLITTAVVLAIFLRGRTTLRPRIWPSWEDLSGLKDAFAVGLPSILSQALIGVNIFILTKLATPFGPSAVSAVGIGTRLDTLAVFPSLAIMVAVLSLVGQNFGARRFERVEQSVRIGLGAAFATLLVIGLVVHFARASVVGLFHPAPEVLPSALHYVGVTSLGFAFTGISIVSSGAFQGLGRGLPFLFLNVLRLVLIAMPAGWLLSTTVGERGLHYTPLLASSASALVAGTWILSVVVRLRRGAATESIPT